MKPERLIEILADVNITPTTKHHSYDYLYNQALTAMTRAVEEETTALRAEVERLRLLLRELAMRTRSAFPENEQDEEWFNSRLKGSSSKFITDLFDTLKL